jgi:uncharacterized membrane protein YgcG
MFYQLQLIRPTLCCILSVTFGLIIVSLFATVWYTGLFVFFNILVGPFYFLFVAIVSFCTVILFTALPDYYTAKGVQLMEQIERFRNFANQVQTQAGFQGDTMTRLLPYAVALDLHGKFGEMIPAYAYATTGDSSDLYFPSMIDGFSSGIAHAAIHPDSSDGGGSSSDSGSSGGGDSGGGGGGW